ncbi:MAG: lysophospholipid acyltransferase family protein [Oscillospiraceae bacterium]
MISLFRFGRELCRAAFWLCFDVSYEGCENIPQREAGYLLVSNHVFDIDPILLAMRIRPAICYLAKAELHRGALGWVFRRLETIPVERGTGDTHSLDIAAEQMSRGRLVGIFPEGTRHRDGLPGRPKSGMALIAKMTGADVLPCAVQYGGGLHFRSKIVIKYGPLIPHAALGLEDDSPRALKRATKKVWGEILSLLGTEEQDDGA